MKTDYSEEIRAIISGNYKPVLALNHESENTEKMPLTKIHKIVTAILPKLWVQESDVYEALQELGFKAFLYTTDAEFDEDDEVVEQSKTYMAYFMDRVN